MNYRVLLPLAGLCSHNTGAQGWLNSGCARLPIISATRKKWSILWVNSRLKPMSNKIFQRVEPIYSLQKLVGSDNGKPSE